MNEAAVIGLIGVAGSGKSRVRSWLAERGFAQLDADAVTRDLLHDPAVIEAVFDAFGRQRVASGPSEGAGLPRIDRTSLAEIVFADADALARLESILHPRVIEVTRDWMREERSSPRVVEAIKLVESGMATEVDEVWLVVCDRAERLRRLALRGWSREEAERRMRAGRSFGALLADCDRVIDNSGAWALTRMQLEAALRRRARRTPADAHPAHPTSRTAG